MLESMPRVVIINRNGGPMACTCNIIPADVLEKLSRDPELSDELRENLRRTLEFSLKIREVRKSAVSLTNAATAMGTPLIKIAATPSVSVYDCKHSQTLPGAPVAHPDTSSDATAKRTFHETTGVADFFKQVFARNSIDNAGMTLLSSIHYGSNFNNAMWNGSQMLYGDGDGKLFVDFTNANDVIGHELTHGVTQHSLQLNYSNDAGGLNESLSDCFGSMFRQWEKKQDVQSADWKIGADILGPVAKSKGYTCLRNMANPADPHALSQQPTKYSQITPGMDPHYSSGPPNLAFQTACKTLGSATRSWEKVGQAWYRAMTGFGPSPNMTMKDFANRTRTVAQSLFGSAPAVHAAVDAGWKAVGL